MDKRAASLCVLMFVAVTAASTISSAQSAPKQVPIPLTFVANAGQLPKPYAFEVKGGDYQAMLLREGVDLYLPVANDHSRRLEFRLVSEGGAATISGLHQARGVSNYFRGSDPSRWVQAAAQYERVELRAAYAGINLIFHVSQEQLEEDFDVAPFADPSKIAFRLASADSLALSPQGDLVSRLGSATFTFKKPLAFQEYGAVRKFVEAKYIVAPDGTVHFKLGKYDSSQRLVIDPVLVFSTYLGGSSTSLISSVTTDATGNVYVAGTTQSIDFPTVNPEQPVCASCTNFTSDPDGFVSEFDPTGHTLLFSTYLGGSLNDTAGSIAIAPDGSIIVSGNSLSSDFPTAGQTVSRSCQINDACFFLASFKPGGAGLNFSGVIGGTDNGGQNSPNPATVVPGEIIAVDAQGNIYLSGDSWDPTFQFTSGTLDSNPPGYPYSFMFVMKVSSAGKLIYSTAIPNNSTAVPNAFQPGGMVVDANGQVTIAGTAGPGLPVPPGALLTTIQNSFQIQGFILQLNSDATALNFATYVPGADYVGDVVADNTGAFLLTGTTEETNLQVSANAYQKTQTQGPSCTCDSGYVLKLDSQAQSVLGATYFSGDSAQGSTNLLRVRVDSQSNVFVGGVTGPSNLPLKNPIISQQRFTNWAWGTIVAELSPDLSTLEFGTYLNGVDNSGLAGTVFADLAVDKQDHVIVVGSTLGNDYPTTPDSLQPNNPSKSASNSRAGFITKLDMATPAPSVCFSSEFLDFLKVSAQTTKTLNLPITNCGNALLHLSKIFSNVTDFVGINPCGAIAPGNSCPIQINFTPLTDENYQNAALTFLDDAAVPSSTIWVSGIGVAGVIQPVPNAIDFGSLLVGGSTGSATINIQNGGNGSLSVQSTTVIGSDFSVVGSGCVGPISLVCTMTIKFSPTVVGPRQGTLQIASNDPILPTLNVPLGGIGTSTNVIPIISSISPLAAQVGGASFTLQVTGLGFSPASVIDINGQPLATTYTNYTSVSATVNSSFLGNAAEIAVTVVNPAPGGGPSNSFPLNVYRLLPVPAVALETVPARNMIYAAVPQQSSVNPNTVIPINPATGAIGTPIPVGKDPRLLAASSDGSYLFVAAQADQTIQRINLQTNTVDQTFPYPAVPGGGTASATEMHGVPGDPHSVVVAFSSPQELALYNDTGLNSSVAVSMSSFAFLNGPSTIYGLPFTPQSNNFPIVTLDSQGLHYTPNTTLRSGPAATGSELQSDGSQLYTSSGQIWDPTSASLAGSFDITIFNLSDSMNVDAPSARTFFVGEQTYAGSNSAIVLSGFDNTTRQLVGMIPFVSVQYPDVASLLRWGSDGFAFIAAAPGTTNPEVYLLHSGMATTLLLGQLSYSPEGLNFGNVNVGAPGVSQNVRLTNGGTGPLVISNISLLLSEDYSQTNDCGTSVPAGTSCTITFTFTPTAGGPRSAGFEIDSSDPLNRQYGSLYGIGVVSLATSVSPSSLSFASLAVGTTSSPQTVSLSNTGTGTATITNTTITGTNAADFQLSKACGSVIPAAGCAIAVTFSPAAPGPSNASLVISDNSTTSPHTVALSGSAVSPSASLSSSALTFNLQYVGSTSASQSVTLTNSSTIPLSISTIAITGTNGSDFLQTNTCGSTVAAGGSCSISVTFEPTAGGSRSASLSITDNATSGVQAVSLSGSGADFAVSGPSGSVTIPAGQPATFQISLTTTGEPTVNTITFSASGNPPYSTVTFDPSTIPSGTSSGGSTMTVATTPRGALLWVRPGAPPSILLLLTVLSILALWIDSLAFRRPRNARKARFVLAAQVIFVILFAVSCGGGGSSGGGAGPQGTPAGTYTITVTATSGSVAHSSSVTLTVN